MIQRFLKNSSWAIGSNVLNKGISFITLGFLARILGPEKLGFYNAVQNAGNYINMMSSLGALLVVQREGAQLSRESKDSLGIVFSNVITLYLMLNLIVAVCVGLFPHFFFGWLLDGRGELSYVYFLSLIILGNALSQVPLSILMGLEEFKKYGILTVIHTILILVSSVTFISILKDNNLAAYYGMISAMVTNGIITLFIFFRVMRRYGIVIKPSLRWNTVVRVLRSGFVYFVGNTLLGSMVGLVTINLFYKHLSSFEYGFTRIGNAFAALLAMIPGAIQPVTISALSRDNQRKEYLKSIQTRILPFCSTLFLIVMAFNMELMLKILFGAQYAGAKDIVFGIILVQIPYLYLGLLNNYQVGDGNLNFVGILSAVGCAIMIGLCYVLIPRLGVNGYFLAMYISTAINLCALLYKEYFKNNYISRHDWNSFILIAILILASYSMMYTLPSVLRIPSTILVLILTLTAFWKYCLASHERDQLSLILAQKIKFRNRQ